MRVTHGPFRNFQGIFERHLSGTERVAILFSAMQGAVRMVLPTDMVVNLLNRIRRHVSEMSGVMFPAPMLKGERHLEKNT